MLNAEYAGYKLTTYQSSDGPRAGVVVNDEVFDAAVLTRKATYATVASFLADWNTAEHALKNAAAVATKSRAARYPLAMTKLLLASSYLIFLCYLLLRRELRRSRSRDGGAGEPTTTLGSSCTKPKNLAFLESAWHDRRSWGGEKSLKLYKAIRLGNRTRCRHWANGQGCPAIKGPGLHSGNTIANDLSARDRFQRANVLGSSPFKYDWIKQKTFDGACPLGPWIVAASDIENPQELALKL